MTFLGRLSALWRLPEQLTALESRMAAREEASRAQLTATVEQVKTAFTSLQTENTRLRDALASADADATRRVDEALAADSDHDADAIDAVNSALSELVPGQQVEVPSGNTSGGDSGSGNTETTPEF